MHRLFDRQMATIADFDCFSQVVFESVDHYKAMKGDPFYKKYLFNDHDQFADTRKTRMTIGWIVEHVRDGEVVDGRMKEC